MKIINNPSTELSTSPSDAHANLGNYRCLLKRHGLLVFEPMINLHAGFPHLRMWLLLHFISAWSFTLFRYSFYLKEHIVFFIILHIRTCSFCSTVCHSLPSNQVIKVIIHFYIPLLIYSLLQISLKSMPTAPRMTSLHVLMASIASPRCGCVMGILTARTNQMRPIAPGKPFLLSPSKN